jgi:hypothetical protein
MIQAIANSKRITDGERKNALTAFLKCLFEVIHFGNVDFGKDADEDDGNDEDAILL